MLDDYKGPERRAECRQGAELEVLIAKLGVKVDNLEKYQRVQNGHAKETRDAVHKLVYLMLATALTAIGGIVAAFLSRL